MPSLTIRVRNMGRLQSKVKGIEASAQRGVIKALMGLSQPIEDDIQQSIRTGRRSGLVVRRYRPVRVVQASAPYEVPANDRGRLANSIEVGVDPVQYNLTISASAPYAQELEYGTRDMLPRPFLRPALARWRDRIVEAIRKAIKGEL